jgi:hypothetical protein
MQHIVGKTPMKGSYFIKIARHSGNLTQLGAALATFAPQVGLSDTGIHLGSTTPRCGKSGKIGAVPRK